jgi:hypothetical protein
MMVQGHMRAGRKGRNWNWRAAATVAASLAALLLLASGALAAWPAPHKVSTGTTTANQNPQIALDGSGNPNVAWQANDGSTRQVYYAENTGSGWTAQKVSTGITTNNLAPQIALDSAGNPNVVWYGNDGSGWQVYYAENTGSGWTPQKVSTGITTDNSVPQIALDSAGNPNVVWFGNDGSTYQVYYAENTGSGWTPQKVSTGTTTNNDAPQIALDSAGNPNVVWFGNDGSTNQVYYAENTGSGWTPQMVSTGTSTDNSVPQIALDGSGNPSVVWYGRDGTTNQVYCAENTGSGWTPQRVSTGTMTDNVSPQIALDGSGNPNMVWYGWGGSGWEIYYAENTGSGWTPQLVTIGTSSGNYYPQIALDADGNPNVVWYGHDISTWQAYYAENTGSEWTPQKVSTGTSTDNDFPQIALDAGGNPSVVWRGNDGSIEQVYYSAPAAPIVTTTAPSDITSTTAKSGGNVTSDGGAAATSRGVCWNTSPNPTTAGSHTSDGTGTGTFTSILTGLSPGTLYHVRAYATNSEGTAYGDDLTFTTTNPVTPMAWYLAEGSNAWGFKTYITIENPNKSAVTARLTYTDTNPAARGKGILFTRNVALPPLSQTTISSQQDIGEVDFSTKVEALEGETIAVDRTMFWTGPGYSAEQSGYHNSIGTTTPSGTWYLPEGSSAWGFETWTLLLNPNPTQANVTLTYMTEGGPKPVNKTIPPNSRASYNMASDIGAADASIKVTSDVPVVAERSMYKNNRREGSCSIGATAPANDYFLAEGATGWDVGFTTWVLVQNPNNADNDVTLTYQTASGEVAGPTFTMRPNSRKTVRLNDQLPANTNVSSKVHGAHPLIAERAMYWDNGTGQAFHASIGLDSPHMTFMLPDGQTSGGSETWTLVQNPNPASVTVRITYLPQGGGTPVSFTSEIPKESRATFSMSDKIPSGRASILVQSLDGARPVMVERAMYMNSRGGGTDIIGGHSF